MANVSAALLFASCVSSSGAADSQRVRDLTHVDQFARVADTEVDPVTAEDARQLLNQPLDADTAVRVALINNRELRATLREMGIARGRLIQAGLLPNPVAEIEMLPERNTQMEFRIEYDLTRAVLAPMRARAAEPELEAARHRAAAAVIDLGYRVRSAFFRLQSAERRLAVAQQMLDAQAARRDASRAMHAAGNIAALDLASEEAVYERSRILVAQLELECATERERVHRLLAIHGPETNWRVRGELPPVPENTRIAADLETRALRASLDLLETKHRLLGLARRTGATRTEGWLPDVAADIHALQGNPESEPGGTQEGGLRFGAGVSVGVPLFDRRQGHVTALQAEFDALLERYFGMAIDLRSAARETRNKVVSAHARARQYQDVIVPAQRRVTEQTILQYNAMQLGIFPLLQARREELDVQTAYVETLREFWTAMAELDALLAGHRVSPDGRAPAAGMSTQGQAAGGH